MIRARKASRLGQSIPRSSPSRSISARVSGGNAPGKLAVARAARTSSSSGATSLGAARIARVRNPIVRRCSLSSTEGGLWSRTASAWPLRSVVVTNRSSGWPSGSSGAASPFSAFIASSASASSREKPIPLNGGANQRARISREILARTSLRVSGATVLETTLPGRLSANHTSGCAQNLVNRENGRASGSSRMSMSALSSHSRVRGSRLCPLAIAWARNTPLIPPALAPATMSVITLSLSPRVAAIVSSRRR